MSLPFLWLNGKEDAYMESHSEDCKETESQKSEREKTRNEQT